MLDHVNHIEEQCDDMECHRLWWWQQLLLLLLIYLNDEVDYEEIEHKVDGAHRLEKRKTNLAKYRNGKERV
jgi:hypothetical protein